MSNVKDLREKLAQNAPKSEQDLGSVITFDERRRPSSSVSQSQTKSKLAPKETPDQTTLKLLKISDEIDAVILKHVQNGDVDVRDLAGLLSHRLGTMMNHIEDKEDLLPICMRVMKRQAKVD
jgi:hypothetical protein